MTKLTMAMEGYLHDATPSWNGYNHQGKVAIFVALKMINDGDLDRDTCQEFEVELEWLEDFAILRNESYWEIHQVKTYADTAPSEYKDAIWLLLAKSLDVDGLQNAFLHSTVEISKQHILKETIKSWEAPKEKSQTEEEKKRAEHYKKYWTPKKCYDHVRGVEAGVDRFDEAYQKFAIYEYEEDCSYCGLDEIEDKIRDQIEIFYSSKGQRNNVERAYYCLLNLVDQNIRKRHKDHQNDEKLQKAPIAFEEIYDLLIKDHEVGSQSYYIYELRDEFNSLTNNYLDYLELEEKLNPGQVFNKSNLYTMINAVKGFDDQRFLVFCQKVTPHLPIKDNKPKTWMKAYRGLIDQNGMYQGVLNILREIEREIDRDKYCFQQTMQDGTELNLTYLPTTIINPDEEGQRLMVARNILNNWMIVDESLHEIDVMITARLNMPQLIPYKIKGMIEEHEITERVESNIEQSQLDRDEYYHRITKIKQIRFMDILNAKGVLDNETNNE